MKHYKLATPATIGVFIVTSLTGLLLFFEISDGSIRATHEWISIAFVLLAGFHIYNHKKSFVRYFSKEYALPIIIGLIAGGVIFVAAYNDIYAAGEIFDLAVNTKLENVVHVFDISIHEAEETL